MTAICQMQNAKSFNRSINLFPLCFSNIVKTKQHKTTQNVAGAFKGTSDPYAIVTLLADKPGAQPQILGKTEV